MGAAPATENVQLSVIYEANSQQIRPVSQPRYGGMTSNGTGTPFNIKWRILEHSIASSPSSYRCNPCTKEKLKKLQAISSSISIKFELHLHRKYIYI